jgi:probable HAF family extracellular repeat protein
VTSYKAVFSLAVLLLATAPLALAQGTYTQIDVPGANSTNAWGVSSKGDVVGSYYDAAFTQHGFLQSGGTYTTIDFPGAAVTVATGVNRSGQIVGFYEPVGNAPFVGFFMDSTGFTSVEYPGSSQTEMTGINDGGQAVGYYANANGFSAGFRWLASTFTKLPVPTGAVAVFVGGINNLGEVVANENRTTTFLNFLVTADGKFLPISFPNAKFPFAYGVNDSGEVVGVYETGTELLGFVLKGRTVTSLSFPNSTQTDAIGINNSGEVAGVFTDTSGKQHGFTWTPPADAAKK